MLALIEARVNSYLSASLETGLKRLTRLPKVTRPTLLQEMHIRAGAFLKKRAVNPSQGSINGRIEVDAPTSSPIGHFVKQLTH